MRSPAVRCLLVGSQGGLSFVRQKACSSFLMAPLSSVGIKTEKKVSKKKKRKNPFQDMPEDLQEMLQGNSSRTRERADSVTEHILQDRLQHHRKMERVEAVIASETLQRLAKSGLGSKKRLPEAYQAAQNKLIRRERSAPATITGAGGRSVHLASCHKDWPIFDHLLPEIAFLGHSNAGKSTLVNAMVGVTPRKGPAKVSDRAGWTDQLCFHQLGRKPPLLTLVDCPGYGHAVATKRMQAAWKKMIDLYLTERLVLSRCYVLVDCTRGLCADDKTLLRKLHKMQIPFKVVLTKCDLLRLEDLARSMHVVSSDLHALLNLSISPSEPEEEGSEQLDLLVPVAASTGANVSALWEDLRRCADQSSPPSGFPNAVREHHLAQKQRRVYQLQQNKSGGHVPAPSKPRPAVSS